MMMVKIGDKEKVLAFGGLQIKRGSVFVVFIVYRCVECRILDRL
jgi:hypothetical protein